jgi:hypothetical protein
MRIKKLYTKYAQKSKIFLYPLLEIKRGGSVTPIQTYMEWLDTYKVTDRKLLCLYYLRDDLEFKNFEKKVLLSHPKFENFFYISEDRGLYVFDFSDENDLFDKIIAGKYSTISKNHKDKILQFFSNNNSSLIYIDSYLNPQKYIKDYANLLGVTEELLKSVGELCALPDLDQEKFTEPAVKIDLIDYL